MYVLFQGEVNVIAGDEGAITTVLNESQVFGERALVTDDPRMATVIANTPKVVCLSLSKINYKEILYHVQVLQRSRRQQFLTSIPFFKEWSFINLLELNQRFNEVKYQPDDIIFNIGSESEVFYVLKSGRLIIETLIEIEDYHKFPVGNQSWEIMKTVKRIQYRLKEIKAGTIFGYEELLLGIKRRCRVRCTTVSEVIYLNKEEFYDVFPKAEVDKLRQELKEIDLDRIVDRIQRLNHDKRLQNNAILDATQINPNGIQSSRMSNVDQRLIRLFPWLEKARSNKTMSYKLLKQLDRIRLLSIKQDKVVINSWDITYQENLKKYEKKTARFVIDDTNNELPGGKQNEFVGMHRRMLRGKSLLERKKASTDASSMTQSFAQLLPTAYAAGGGGRKLHGIIVEVNDPDRLEVDDINDGTQIVSASRLKKRRIVLLDSDGEEIERKSEDEEGEDGHIYRSRKSQQK